MIHHVTREIQPSELDRCISFYGLLGFRPVPVPASLAGAAVWLQRGETQIHLLPDAAATPQRGHVGIVVSRYDEVLAQLQRQGHEVEPRREHWGSPRSQVRDPAGNIVELMAWPPCTATADGAGRP